MPDDEHQSLGLWVAIGAAAVTVGGIVAGFGLVEEASAAHLDLWSNIWVILGAILLVLGCSVLATVTVIAIVRWWRAKHPKPVTVTAREAPAFNMDKFFEAREMTKPTDVPSAPPGSVAPSGSLSMTVVRGEESADVDLVHFTTQAQPLATKRTRRPPAALRFTIPLM